MAADSWFDDLEEGVVSIADGVVARINRAAAEMLQVDPQRAQGQPLIAVVRDHRLERCYLDRETVEVHRHGQTIVAVPLATGLLLRDVSELRASQQSAHELLAVLSHELRTPVTTIRATLEALRYDLRADRRSRFLDRAEAETDRLVRLLADLTVDVSPPRERSLLLAEVIERAVIVLQPTLVEHHIELRSAVPDCAVWADPDKLLQVVVNLIENAAVHGPDRAAVWLRTRPDPDHEPYLDLLVQDSGIPLPLERIGELFEAHTRGSSAKAKGTGLGLFIVRSIADRWGGAAWGRPLADGNEFGVRIPLRRL